jgi:hypothetical protein
MFEFADELNGYAVSSSSSFTNGVVIKTSDVVIHGLQYIQMQTNGLLGLTVVDANTVYAGGNG